MAAQKRAAKALQRLNEAREDNTNSHPKVKAAEKEYNDAIKELKRAMKGKAV